MFVSIVLFASAAAALVISTPVPTTASPPNLLHIRDTTTAPASVPTGYFITTKHVIIPGQTGDHFTIAEKTINIAIPTCIQTITPDKNGYVPPGTCGSLYNYYPSFGLALAFGVLFGVLTVAHLVQAVMLKIVFAWVLIMAVVWETAAFSFRAISTKNQQSEGLALVSTIFVLLAPLWINAFAYMVLARMIHYFHPARSVFSIPASLLSLIFVTLDIVSFAIQLTGGSYASRRDPVEKQMKGVHIYMGGIAIQQFFIFMFLAVAGRFHMQMLQLDRERGNTNGGWTALLYTLYASLVFVSIRIFYRLVEFSAGKDTSNPLPFHESYLYILEATPMFMAIMAFNIIHPGNVLRGPDAKLPGLWAMVRRKGKKGGAKGDDGEKLVPKYTSLDDKALPEYSSQY
ncbi:RTA1 domain-containing protein [Bisporella sp. PMI_857]|nr:RTA1 domain-containing protein [Bisporella sp. PMI_857]